MIWFLRNRERSYQFLKVLKQSLSSISICIKIKHSVTSTFFLLLSVSACPPEYYQLTVSSFQCIRCPSNSVNTDYTTTKTTCQCKIGYYRPIINTALLTPCYGRLVTNFYSARSVYFHSIQTCNFVSTQIFSQKFFLIPTFQKCPILIG